MGPVCGPFGCCFSTLRTPSSTPPDVRGCHGALAEPCYSSPGSSRPSDAGCSGRLAQGSHVYIDPCSLGQTARVYRMRTIHWLAPFSKVPEIPSEKQPSAEHQANWFSRATWTWLSPLLKVSMRRYSHQAGNWTVDRYSVVINETVFHRGISCRVIITILQLIAILN